MWFILDAYIIENVTDNLQHIGTTWSIVNNNNYYGIQRIFLEASYTISSKSD